MDRDKKNHNLLSSLLGPDVKCSSISRRRDGGVKRALARSDLLLRPRYRTFVEHSRTQNRSCMIGKDKVSVSYVGEKCVVAFNHDIYGCLVEVSPQ